jgi:anti-sigma regulatory factor (Ser/Thr protein kinase)
MPDELPEPGRDEGARGWGMFFIEQLVDEIEITRLPQGGNQVRMVIYLTPDPNKKTDGEE